MKRITMTARVDSDGVLKLSVPVGTESANQEVLITIAAVSPPTMTQQEWEQGILRTAGTWEGEFERPDQGEYEEREWKGD